MNTEKLTVKIWGCCNEKKIENLQKKYNLENGCGNTFVLNSLIEAAESIKNQDMFRIRFEIIGFENYEMAKSFCAQLPKSLNLRAHECKMCSGEMEYSVSLNVENGSNHVMGQINETGVKRLISLEKNLRKLGFFN